MAAGTRYPNTTGTFALNPAAKWVTTQQSIDAPSDGLVRISRTQEFVGASIEDIDRAMADVEQPSGEPPNLVEPSHERPDDDFGFPGVLPWLRRNLWDAVVIPAAVVVVVVLPLVLGRAGQ